MNRLALDLFSGKSIDPIEYDYSLLDEKLHAAVLDAFDTGQDATVCGQPSFMDELESFDVMPTDDCVAIRWPSRKIATLSSVEARLDSTERLLKAISAASAVLVAEKDIDAALQECIDHIGKGVDIDRLSIYRCHTHPVTGGDAYSLRARWCNDRLDPKYRDTNKSNIPWDPHLTHFKERLQSGQLLASVVSELTESEREHFQSQGRKAVLSFPVFVDRQWWGVISFDEFGSEHRWTEVEVAGIRTLATSLGNYIGRQKSSLALEQSEELHRTILDNSKDVIYTIFPGGDILFASRSIEQCLGFDPELCLGKNIYDFVHPDDKEPLKLHVQSLLSGQEVKESIDFRTLHRDGSWRHVVASTGAVRNEDGEAELIVGIVKDITERVLYEAKLQALTNELLEANLDLTEARDKALQASQAKSQFLANMSHEIRTPLNGVLGMTSLLLDRDCDAESRDLLTTIQTSGETLLRVINDVLDLSRIEAGKLSIETSEIEIGTLVKDVKDLYAEMARSKGIDLICQCPEISPPSVFGDPTRIRQVITNLVSNAIKFTHEGSITLSWKYEERFGCLHFSFAVKDSGVGIPKDRLDAIFDRFTQAEDSTHRLYGGSGLGLAICRRLVELMGGTVAVESAVGSGSTFTFSIDLEIAGKSPVASRAEHITSSPSIREARILLAEDNPINIKVACHMLKRCGVGVDVANDGNEAIALALEHEYDMILMDMEMPECGGLEATRILRSEEKETKTHRTIIALTANAMSSDRQACLEAGMDGFIAKPLSLEALKNLLGEWLGNAQAA